LDRHLARRGFSPVNIGYPSRSLDVRSIADHHLAPVVARIRCGTGHPIHFVGHSLGGIVVRQYLQDHEVPAGSRFVMLAPPNRGSELADALMRYHWYRRFMGPAAIQLGTAADSVPNRLGAATVPVGVIAGTKSCLPFSHRIFQGPNDGKVAVERTRLAGMADFLVLPCGHTFMTRDRQVMNQIARTGTFDHHAI
jgi:pimeloyl-ACP methyl ester carboxylesterase